MFCSSCEKGVIEETNIEDPTEKTSASAAAFSAVAQAATSLEEDEKKNAKYFASDPSFLAALVKVP